MNYRQSVALVLLIVSFISCSRSSHEDPMSYDRIVAGGEKTFLSARHVVLKGSNFEIGQMIAQIGKQYGVQPFQSRDSVMTRLRREYFAKSYPILYDRAKGVASAFGTSIDDNRYDFFGVSQGFTARPGCSVVFYPPQYTENGHGILSRNYDFHVGTIQGTWPDDKLIAVMSRPHIFELYPNEGYASLSICAFDLMGGVLDGINSEGLAVAILADDESPDKVGLESSYEVGFSELLSMRYLLDNCRNVDEAKEALLSLKHFYGFIPCHYIVSDRQGKSFIFEFSPQRNKTIITDGQGPQCVTNHLVAYHQSADSLPAGDSFQRYRSLYDATRDRPRFSLREIESINEGVAVSPNASKKSGRPPLRTLWYTMYDTERRGLRVKFYLGEGQDHPRDTSEVKLEYSDYVEIALDKK